MSQIEDLQAKGFGSHGGKQYTVNHDITPLKKRVLVSKMHFGETSASPGKPPPVLRFYAYGDLMFKNVPVTIRSFSYDLPNEVDYVDVEIPYSGGKKAGGGSDWSI